MKITEKRREIIKLVIVFVIMLVAAIALMNGVFWVLYYLGIEEPLIVNALLNELCMLVPAFVYIKMKGEKLTDSLGFHKIKVSTVFLTLILAVLSVPVYVFANTFSQLFVPNAMAQASSELTAESTLGVSMLIVTMIAPIVEEICFRGFFSRQFKGLIGIGFAAVVSAVMFGIFHMNINQFCYAFVLGVIFALADYAANSIWPSIIMHMLINSFGMIVMYIATIASEAEGMDFAEAAESVRTTGNTMLIYAIVSFVISIFSVLLIRVVLRAIARRQNNEEALEAFTSKKHRTQELQEA